MTDVLAKGPNPNTAKLVPTGPNPATARVVAAPKEKGFFDAMTDVLGSMQHDFVAGMQQTSPDTSMYEKLGEVNEYDFGPAFKGADGKPVMLNAKDHVVFRDPESGKIMAYKRNPEAEEPVASFGRVLGMGMITGPVTQAVKGVATAGKAASVADDFARHGVEAGAAQLSTNRTAQAAQNALREVPIASNVIENAEKGVIQGTAQAVEKTAGKFGDGHTLEDAGRALKDGADKFIKGTGEVADADLLKAPTRKGGFDNKSRALYNKLDSYFKEGDTIDVKKSMEALTQPPSKFENAALAEAFVDPKLKPFADAIKGSSNGKLSFSDLKAFRTEVGKKLRKPSIMSDIDQDQLINLYAALSDDMRAAAALKGPEAARAFERANTYFKVGLDRIKNTLSSVIKEVNSPEKVAGDLQSIAASGKKSANIDKLRKLRKSMPAEEWGIVSSSLLREMGKPTAGAADVLKKADFSPATFLTKWESLSPKAKTELFTTAGNQELRKDLDSLVRMIGNQKNLGKLANSSGTARQVLFGAMGAGLMTEPVSTILTGVSAVTAAWMLTSPKVVKALTGLGAAGKKAPVNTSSVHFARLRHALSGSPVAEADLNLLLSQGEGTAQATEPEKMQPQSQSKP